MERLFSLVGYNNNNKNNKQKKQMQMCTHVKIPSTLELLKTEFQKAALLLKEPK